MYIYMLKKLGAFSIAAYYQTIGWMKTFIADDITPNKQKQSTNILKDNYIMNMFKNKDNTKSNSRIISTSSSNNYKNRIISTYNNPYIVTKRKRGILKQLYINIKSILFNIYNILFMDDDNNNLNNYRGNIINPWSLPTNINTKNKIKKSENNDKIDKLINIVAILIIIEFIKQFIFIFYKIYIK